MLRRSLPALAALCSLSLVLNSLAAAEPAGEEFAGAQSEIYKQVGPVELKISIFNPEGHGAADRTPAIVFFFGGGWKAGKPGQFEQQCRYLASRGMVAMTADYRVSSRHHTQAKECVQDGRSALRWVRSNAGRLGIDPDRIVAAGGSAGGHVAACTLLEGGDEPGESTAVSCTPNALVLFNPVMALAPTEGFPAEEAQLAELKARLGTDPVDLSPAHHIRPGLPPSIIFFGTDDSLLKGAQAYQKLTEEAGNRCTLTTYEGERHGFFNFGRNGNAYFRETLAAADRYLISLGYLEGAPNVDAWMKSQVRPLR